MKLLTRFVSPLVLCLALCIPAFAVHADELQDAQLLVKEGKASQALDKLNSYLAKRPKDPQARFMKGMIYTQAGRTQEAIKVFQDLTVDYPDLPEPYNNLAVLYFGMGQYDKARNALETAIRTHPAYATAHENLGDVYAKLASQAYNKALQLDHSNTNAQTKLALITELFNPPASINSKPAPVAVAAAPAAPAAPAAAKQPAAPAPAPAAPAVAAAKPATPPVTVAAAKPVEKPVVAPTPAKPVEPPAAKPAAVPSEKAQDKAAEKERKEKEKEADKPNPQDVVKAANAWARAWSNKNVSAYIAAYDRSYKPAGDTRANWEKVRKERITHPRSIKVQLLSPQVSFKDSRHASITFRQNYESDALKSTTRKTLTMVKSGERWLIVDESTH